MALTNNTIPTSQAYTYQAPAGVPGDLTRTDESSVEPALLVAPLAQFSGGAMVYGTGGVAAWGGANVAADFAGTLVRQAPGISDPGSDTLAGGVPQAVQIQGLLVRGYMNVLCVYGTPARGGVVYVRTVANGNNATVGTFDATADGGNNVALSSTQASWATDGKDANNNAELRVAR